MKKILFSLFIIFTTLLTNSQTINRSFESIDIKETFMYSNPNGACSIEIKNTTNHLDTVHSSHSNSTFIIQPNNSHTIGNWYTILPNQYFYDTISVNGVINAVLRYCLNASRMYAPDTAYVNDVVTVVNISPTQCFSPNANINWFTHQFYFGTDSFFIPFNHIWDSTATHTYTQIGTYPISLKTRPMTGTNTTGWDYKNIVIIERPIATCSECFVLKNDKIKITQYNRDIYLDIESNYCVYNILGSQVLANHGNRIDMETFPPGVYFIVINGQTSKIQIN